MLDSENTIYIYNLKSIYTIQIRCKYFWDKIKNYESILLMKFVFFKI